MNSAIVRLATVSDIGILVLHDRHVSKNILEQAVEARHVMVIEEDGGFAGWLRWSLFWDSIPFLNMLFLLQPVEGNDRKHFFFQFADDAVAAGRRMDPDQSVQILGEEFPADLLFRIGCQTADSRLSLIRGKSHSALHHGQPVHRIIHQLSAVANEESDDFARHR